MVTKRNIFMTGADSTNTSKYSTGLPDTSHLLHMPVCLSVCFYAPQGWVCLFQQGPFLRAGCMKCMWQFRGRTTWGTQCRLPHQCPGAVFTPVSTAVSPIHWECCCIAIKQCVCVCLYLHLQAFGGRWPNSARPCGELWAPRGLVDSASHHHHAPLRRVWWPTGLAYPAQEPFPAEPVGGKLQEARKKSPNTCGQVLKVRYAYYFRNDVINPAFHWLENSTRQWSKTKDIINKNEEWECDDRYGGGEGDQIPLLCFCSTALRANASLQPGAEIVNLV